MNFDQRAILLGCCASSSTHPCVVQAFFIGVKLSDSRRQRRFVKADSVCEALVNAGPFQRYDLIDAQVSLHFT